MPPAVAPTTQATTVPAAGTIAAATTSYSHRIAAYSNLLSSKMHIQDMLGLANALFLKCYEPVWTSIQISTIRLYLSHAQNVSRLFDAPIPQSLDVDLKIIATEVPLTNLLAIIQQKIIFQSDKKAFVTCDGLKSLTTFLDDLQLYYEAMVSSWPPQPA